MPNVGRLQSEKCMFVEVEKHLRCGCRCMMTEASCDPVKQEFMPERCSCVCKDSSMASQCADNGKMWDPMTCQCECPPTVSRHCSTGAVFDNDECR